MAFPLFLTPNIIIHKNQKNITHHQMDNEATNDQLSLHFSYIYNTKSKINLFLTNLYFTPLHSPSIQTCPNLP